ncbi:MAG TPA: hypothetical protein ENG91_04810 [Desulfobacteraceae bacterium]|nr:hypothetical protein [Desulfobacteraceae bacterium]HDL98700.1 hypothetical protein [Desulfobacteraceae bacterium]HDO31137.1 hypothetical protein [Desulfobacteraceae bacterium]
MLNVKPPSYYISCDELRLGDQKTPDGKKSWQSGRFPVFFIIKGPLKNNFTLSYPESKRQFRGLISERTPETITYDHFYFAKKFEPHPQAT